MENRWVTGKIKSGMRLLQQFCQKFQYSAKNANSLFLKYGIWKYIEDCYDSLNMNGDEYIMNDIQEILHARGAVL